MKRRVKAFVSVMPDGTLGSDRSPRVYFRAYDFENERLYPKDSIVPCIIEYEDGKPPKRKKAK